jgi:uncharacterized membrane protein
MIGTIEAVWIAAIAFVAIHVASSTPLRAAITRRLGEGPFLLAFSVLSAVVFLWLVTAYLNAPPQPLYAPPLWGAWVPTVFMPFAFVFLIGGLTSRNPVNAGMGAAFQATNPAPGFLTVTRHPLFWGIGLWALGHLFVRGDLASVVFFGTLALLAFAGMPLVDKKKEEQFGAHWGPFALRTSVLPFAAALQGRTKIDWRGIGWWRPLLGLALWALFMGVAHKWMFGVAPHP